MGGTILVSKGNGFATKTVDFEYLGSSQKTEKSYANDRLSDEVRRWATVPSNPCEWCGSLQGSII